MRKPADCFRNPCDMRHAVNGPIPDTLFVVPLQWELTSGHYQESRCHPAPGERVWILHPGRIEAVTEGQGRSGKRPSPTYCVVAWGTAAGRRWAVAFEPIRIRLCHPWLLFCEDQIS